MPSKSLCEPDRQSLLKIETMQEDITSSLNRLLIWCQKHDFQGWDLFDGLNSRILQKTFLYKSILVRLAWIQLFKRSPVNLRILAMVPKGYNAKGLALFASGLLRMGRISEAKDLLLRLKQMTCSGYQGTSWGYNFPWQARAFYVPQGKPNMVTTVFVANAFLDYLAADERRLTQVKRDKAYLRIAEGACDFILNELVVFEDNDRLCFGYIPGEEARVHNANMLGAALLGRVYNLTRDENLLLKSRKAMAYSMDALRDDFSWPYGERSHHQFVDNFHTGFNLVALNEWMKYTEDFRWKEQLNGAYRYFLDTFWLEDGCPKYYNNSLYPIDIHCSAQGIITCLKLSQLDDRSLPLAERIATWAIENMQDKEGYFYYQKTKWYTNKIPYIRWTQAWMFFALTSLLANQQNYKTSKY